MRYIFPLLLLASLASCGYDGPTKNDLALDRWLAEAPHTGGVMFVGDSITARWPAEYMPEGAYNRGVAGNTTADVLGRTWFIIEEAPDELYLMIGINNLHEGYPAASVSRGVGKIVDRVREGVPGVNIYVMALLPSVKVRQDKVDAANAQIRATLPASVQFLDTAYLDVPTRDGIHPTEDGYAVLYEFIK